MNNLKASIQALSPAVSYTVKISKVTDYTSSVMAKTREEAEEKAWEEYHNGILGEINTSEEITEVFQG